MAISGNIFLWFIDSPGFNIVKSLKITIVGVPSFSVGAGLGYVNYSSFNCCKEIIFVLYKSDRRVVNARILVSLGSVLVPYCADTILLYFSAALWMSYLDGTSLPVNK